MGDDLGLVLAGIDELLFVEHGEPFGGGTVVGPPASRPGLARKAKL
jgi:hypothetical protein